MSSVELGVVTQQFQHKNTHRLALWPQWAKLVTVTPDPRSWCWFQSRLLHLQTRFLLMLLERHWKITLVLMPLPTGSDQEEAGGSWLQAGPDLAVVAVGGMNSKWKEDLCLSPLEVYFVISNMWIFKLQRFSFDIFLPIRKRLFLTDGGSGAPWHTVQPFPNRDGKPSLPFTSHCHAWHSSPLVVVFVGL